jgi:hypothetical protein
MVVVVLLLLLVVVVAAAAVVVVVVVASLCGLFNNTASVADYTLVVLKWWADNRL